MRSASETWQCIIDLVTGSGSKDVEQLNRAAGVMGSLQALEVLKEITGVGTGLAGKLLLYNALSAQFRTITLPPDPACPLCGKTPTTTRLTGI